MKNIKKLFFTLIILLLSQSVTLASHTGDQENIADVQKILFPHISFYTRKTLFDDIATPSKQVEAAQFLYKEVTLDKDYLAARALIRMTVFNSTIANYLKNEPYAKNKIHRVLALGVKIDEERTDIDNSIHQALDIINNSKNSKLKEASLWLQKPLPINKIKCFAKDILLFGEMTEEMNKIVEILAGTEFGKAQLAKILKFRRDDTFDLGPNLSNNFKEPHELDEEAMRADRELYNLDPEVDVVEEEEIRLDAELYKADPKVYAAYHALIKNQKKNKK